MSENKEKKDESSEDLEKYYDESTYNTIVVGEGKFASPKKLLIEEVINVLITHDHHQKDQALVLLKENNSQQLLIDAINDDDYKKFKVALLAACWESGLDFSDHIELFSELCGDENLLISLEAITVIQQMENLKTEAVIPSIKALEEIVNSGHQNIALITDIIVFLRTSLQH